MIKTSQPLETETEWHLSLRSRMILSFGGICSLLIVVLILLKLFGLPWLGIDGTYQAQLKQAEQNLGLVADYKKNLFEIWLHERRSELKMLADNDLMPAGLNEDVSSPLRIEALENRFATLIESVPEITSLCLYDLTSGTLLAAVQQRPGTGGEKNFLRQVAASSQRYQVGIVHDRDHQDCGLFFGQQVPLAGVPQAVLVARTQTKIFLEPLLHNVQGLKESGEIVLIDQQQTLVSPLKFPLQDSSSATPLETRMLGPAAAAAAKGQEISVRGHDYRGVLTSAVTRKIDLGDGQFWGMVVKQDYSDVLEDVVAHVVPFATAGGVGLILLLGAIFVLSRRMTEPLRSLANCAEAIRGGDLSARAIVKTKDEIGQLTEVFNAMAEQISSWQSELERAVSDKTEELSLAYQSLQRAELRRTSINEMTSHYLKYGDLNRVLEFLTEKTLQFTGGWAGRFLRIEDDGHAVRVVHASSLCWAEPAMAETLAPEAVAAMEHMCQRISESGSPALDAVVRTGQAQIMDGEQFRRRLDPTVIDSYPKVAALLLVPVSFDQKIVGIIAMTKRKGSFGDEEVRSVEAFAAGAALLIHAEEREIARAAAEEVAHLRSEFMTNMSHELRTPLNVIIGLNSLLRGLKHSAVEQDYLKKVDFSAHQLLGLIDDLLDISKLEAGEGMALQEERFEPEELIYQAVQLLAFRQKDKKVELHVDIDRSIPSHLIGDHRRLVQILNNLLSNALKFSDEGAVILQVKEVARTEYQVTLGFKVIDEGIGMTNELLERIFKPFVQIDATMTRQQGGSGLGLSLSRQLCRLMGGDLVVDSTAPGRGSTFSFTLPFFIADGAEGSLPGLVPADGLLGLRVLVVNGCPVCCEILERMLRDMRFQVQTVRSCYAAQRYLDYARTQGTPFRLMLIGETLEDLSGVACVEQQQAFAADDDNLRRILIVNPSVVTTLFTQVKTFKLDGLVATPARPSELFDAIMDAFGHTLSQASTEAAVTSGWGQCKVLLVDDNDLGREMACALLEHAGLLVSEATNGAEALAKVEAENFDLVFMDIQMPVMDGLSAVRAIRKLDKAGIQELPIVAMTAHASEEHRRESLAAGMSSHITKPIELETLTAELQRWLPQENPALEQPIFSVGEVPGTDGFEEFIPGVDAAAGLRRVAGDRQLYLQLWRRFADQFSTLESQLHEYLQSDNFQEAALLVHSLKGVTGNLGAQRLFELAGQVEKQLTQAQSSPLVAELCTEHERLLTAVQQFSVTAPSAVESDKPAGTQAELKARLWELLIPLQQLQVRQVKAQMALLAEKNWPELYKVGLAEVQKLVENYRLPDAAEKIQALLNEDRE